jgi:hypothetical protein
MHTPGTPHPTPLKSNCLRAILCMLLAFSLWTASGLAQESKAHFMGSESCKACHAEVYKSWKQIRMANVVRDPKEHPEAVLADFTHADQLQTFDLKDVAFTYGSRWKRKPKRVSFRLSNIKRSI